MERIAKPNSRSRIRASLARYRVEPRMSFLAGCLYPGFVVAPSSLSLVIGALTIPRLMLFFASIFTVREYWRKLTTGGYVPIASDFVVPLMSVWILISLLINEGVGSMIGSGAVSALEFSLAYYLARVLFGTPAGFDQFVRIMRFVAGGIAATALLDTLSGQNLMARIGFAISRTGPTELSLPMRFGLIRAQGSLEHPILLGTFLVVCVIIFAFSNLKATQKTIWIAVCVFGAMLPLSSAPLLSLVMIVGFVVFLKLFDRFPWRMLVLCSTAVFLMAAFFALVDNPLTTLIQNLTYDPQTGMFRVLIWQWVSLNIERAPWLGIGFGDWMRADDMPGSVDSLYLVQALRHGLPAVALLWLSMLTTGITMPLRPQHRYPSEHIAKLRTAMAIAIFIYCFNAFTVHIWGANWTMMAIILGIRAGLTESVFLDPVARGDAVPMQSGIPAMLAPSPIEARRPRRIKTRPAPRRRPGTAV